MHWIDILVLIPIVMGLVKGVQNGFIDEVIAIGGIIVAFLGANLIGGSVAQWLVGTLHCNLIVAEIIAYVLIFVICMLILRGIGRLLSKLLDVVLLGWLNRLLGAFFGATKWLLIVTVIVFCVNRVDSLLHFMPPANETPCYTLCVELGDTCWERL